LHQPINQSINQLPSPTMLRKLFLVTLLVLVAISSADGKENGFADALNAIKAQFEKVLKLVPGLGEKVEEAKEAASNMAGKVEEEVQEKIEQEQEQVEEAIQEETEAIQEEREAVEEEL
jgi:peptidoglycan hydrolase CwlO-like protein